MTNPFDLGGYEPQAMSGLFSKIKKAVKKTVKSTTKSVKNVAKVAEKSVKTSTKGVKNIAQAAKATVKNPLDPKAHLKLVKTQASNVKANIKTADSMARAVQKVMTPPQVEAIRKKVSGEIRKSPIAMAVVMVAASFLIGPAVAALANQFGVVSVNLIKGATAIAKSAANDMLKAAHVKALTADAKKTLEKQMSKMTGMITELSKDKDFQKTVADMKAQGKSDADIIIAWSNSTTAVAVAENQVAALLLPEITTRLKADKSVPSNDVASIAASTAKQMAADLVKQARTTQISPVVNAAQNSQQVTQTAAPNVLPQAPAQPINPLIPIAAVTASLFM